MKFQSGQWCLIHDRHQDDPGHDYDYLVCEGHHREATLGENLRAVLASRLVASGQARTCEHDWHWRRKRNSYHGYWECVRCDKRSHWIVVGLDGQPSERPPSQPAQKDH